MLFSSLINFSILILLFSCSATNDFEGRITFIQPGILIENDNKDIKKPLKFINPEITKLSKNISEFEEGCLSLPSQYAKVIRPSEITLKYKNTEILN